ncbi:MAG: aminodeoxychorismate/anthranilate synthase component II [Actinobacteria bacterium]|nr:aminodeoxychorismate/anthranilate synthase component II [Actinomycetota bacterium]NDH13007.1 aminodeoxychorismate/anthranilate synthase component II [Actinomycetota bacterium]TRZ83906.1 MAG: aminodeoxychorismate/anthranilate synthase component II [Streptomycetaceae bacterium]
MQMKILVVNNFDSFVFNLVDYLKRLGADCTVLNNDQINISEIENYNGVLISPGPGTPEGAGVSIDVVKKCAELRKPLLGVCLGHQAIGVAFGGIVERAPELLHGKTSEVTHNNVGVLQNIASPFTATRYHSLIIKSNPLPQELEVTAKSESGIIMAIKHRTLPIEGVQFHPEAILTEHGYQIMGNWLLQCGDQDARKRSEGFNPIVARG